MNKPLIVLADIDANYIIPLEEKITEELFDQIDLEIITDSDYFKEYFSVPKTIDTLIVCEELYSSELAKQNISNVFILSENAEQIIDSSDNVIRIFKYSSTKEVLDQITYKNKRIKAVQNLHKQTQLVVITSASGGSGKTTISMALAHSLSKNHKRVLFISMDAMQGFAYYLKNNEVSPNSIFKAASSGDERLMSSLKPFIRNEYFYYIPPLGRNLITMGLDYGFINRIVEAAKQSREYDYIIVDTQIEFDDSRATLIKNADKVIILVTQDAVSALKTSFLVRNMECKNTEKFVFVCNKFRRDDENEYMVSAVGQQMLVAEYIEELPHSFSKAIDNFSSLNGIKNLVYMLI